MKDKLQNIHFISIGGAAMHNLAIALHLKGITVTGSDDEILDPSRSRLQRHGLLPEKDGWYPEKIHSGIDAVILGMHAREDNPELKKAQELGLPVYSYPEFVYEHSVNKQRIVIVGSHGKTTITSLILHVLKHLNRKFDYLVGAQIEGFETMVQLTDDAPIIVIEGDEYFASPIHRKPKFLYYQHHIGLMSGIAWDHINVYPDFDEYVKQFELFAESTPKAGSLIFDKNDDLVTVICRKEREDVARLEYDVHPHRIKDGKTYLLTSDNEEIPVSIFGEHNMRNINGAKAVLERLGIEEAEFYKAVSSFKGAARRLEIVGSNATTTFFRDFAHAPSKLEATTQAVKAQFPKRKLIACMELHTFSSLNKTFLKEYKDTFNKADVAVAYYNPHTVEHKRLEPLSEKDIKIAFNRPDLQVFTDSEALKEFLLKQSWQDTNLLMMSSGNYNGLDMKNLSEHIL
ncbi:Mur ligase domain-containing protein [Cytophagaceae bacterium DM2B3-1]|uniref:Mur ligase domain-containing protein n=1 Tax=Xanthocytophaga flava TaxID=3048013 RepID=A0ABT7CKL9_9BACT|nr:Mur ligase domain-containing protein [Xanthocytophaga flavus]MDJ1494247.1 Mur ligase domain-containing protein [Xanthocytophaga flavus]